MTTLWIAAYIGSVVAINFAFSARPDLDVLWAMWTGLIFILRDMVQTRVGHWALAAMVVALVGSYLTSDPFVAIASATAFAASEAIDWAVFTITKRPLRDRLWLSSAASIPVDTALFLGLLGAWVPSVWAIALASKLAGVSAVWVGLRAGGVAARSAAAP